MDVPVWVWLATVGGIVALFALDLVIVDRKPHAVGLAEAARWVVFYFACAAVFGLGVWLLAGGDFATEFIAGYLTEYSLSVDNLFVFVIIMTAFKVPIIQQHRVLLIGIVLALALRGLFIAAGAALISSFSWMFYLFGALLIYLGYRQVRQRTQDANFSENIVLRALRKLVPVTDEYNGARLTFKRDGKRWFTPMIVVMIAIGSVDLVFALDSIPAIFGLTQEVFLVFTVNAFALMGLRQLYFLIGGLLARLAYLSIGLGVILGFIGVKLVLDALDENSLPFLNDGQPLESVPTVGIELSLAVIVGVLLVTILASVLATRRHRGDPSTYMGSISSQADNRGPAKAAPSDVRVDTKQSGDRLRHQPGHQLGDAASRGRIAGEHAVPAHRTDRIGRGPVDQAAAPAPKAPTDRPVAAAPQWRLGQQQRRDHP